MRIILFGSTGTIGSATKTELLRRGHEVVCFGRGVERVGDVTDPTSIARDGFRGERFDAVVSCLASRSGLPRDAELIDHQSHSNILSAAKHHGVKHFVLLSAICVQKPKLSFQFAKLKFEQELIASGLTYSIVRPTAYFKSLSGQVKRVKASKAFLIFGDGNLTACKPISDGDLAKYLCDCLEQPNLQNAVLPIGGPGPAMSPRQQGEALFKLAGKPAKFKKVPVAILDAIITTLNLLGKISPRLAHKAELAKIGKYYATESMLVWSPAINAYDAEATPSFGTETLQDYHAKLISGETKLDLREHSVF